MAESNIAESNYVIAVENSHNCDFNNLTDYEKTLLHDEELNTKPKGISVPQSSKFLKNLVFEYSNSLLPNRIKYVAQCNFKDSVDPLFEFKDENADLPPPKLKVRQNSNSGLSVYIENPVEPLVGQFSNFYYEIDICEDFNTNKLFRYPNLYPIGAEANLSSSLSLTLNVFQSSLRVFNNEPKLKSIFNINTMADLSDRLDLFEQINAIAQILKYGQDEALFAEEVCKYVKNNILCGWNSLEITPLDIYKAKIAGCGSYNDYAGYLLELGGMRYRGIAGFNPIHRNIFSGGGHSAIEAMIDGRWSYMDPFLDVFAKYISAYQFNEENIGNTKLFGGVPPENIDLKPNEKQIINNFNLKELFKYRIYYDKTMRELMINLSQIDNRKSNKKLFLNEENYGMSWMLRRPESLDLNSIVPKNIKLYIRARQINASCSIGTPEKSYFLDEIPSYSKWGVTSFDFKANTYKD